MPTFTGNVTATDGSGQTAAAPVSIVQTPAPSGLVTMRIRGSVWVANGEVVNQYPPGMPFETFLTMNTNAPTTPESWTDRSSRPAGVVSVHGTLGTQVFSGGTGNVDMGILAPNERPPAGTDFWLAEIQQGIVGTLNGIQMSSILIELVGMNGQFTALTSPKGDLALNIPNILAFNTRWINEPSLWKMNWQTAGRGEVIAAWESAVIV